MKMISPAREAAVRRWHRAASPAAPSMAAWAIALCAAAQAQAQSPMPAPGAASAPGMQGSVHTTQAQEVKTVQLNLTFNASEPGTSARLGGVSICSAVACVDAATPASVPVTTTEDGRSTLVAKVVWPYAEVSSIRFKAVAGTGAGTGGVEGRVNLPQALALGDGLIRGNVLVVAQRQGSAFIPVAAAASYLPPEESLSRGAIVYYNPKFDLTAIGLRFGVKLNIPAGATASPQVFSVNLNDTGDEYPMVYIFPELKLAKSAFVELPAFVREPSKSADPSRVPEVRGAPPSPAPGWVPPQPLPPPPVFAWPLKVRVDQTGPVPRDGRQSQPIDAGTNAPVVIRENPPKEELARLESAFVWDKAGFFRVTGIPDQIKVPESMVKLNRHRSGDWRSIGCTASRDLNSIGVFPESNHMNSYLFKRGSLSGMLTVSDLKANGGSVTMIRHFLRTDVRGKPGTLTFVDANQDIGLWKLAWADGGTYNDFYLQDHIVQNPRRPALSPQRVVELAESINCR